ncbi:response regulator [Paenibacillus thalictri]|uniref:Response regulator n=1 Tax=Paenibacillus thalictri TaxID=2527873 RepID=A0A4Q9DGX4_9BACL|nr:response regulator [Paenibacillus thalictri]TBL71597.1 response regulator [Paenibacillus thalictri]
MFELLIVDDEKFVVHNLATTYPWEELGITAVHTAYSAKEALQLIQYENIHIVITDIRMPGISGLELIEKIRALSGKTKCILLSGHSDFSYAQQAVSSGVVAYLLKPVKEDELLHTVRIAIEQIEAAWNEIVSQQRTLYTLSEHLPQLRGALLNDLLQGKYIPPQTLDKKLLMYKLQAKRDQQFVMMFVRMEQGFSSYDDYSRSLLEFAITNIGEEIFGEQFYLWQCKDIYDYLVFVIMPKTDHAANRVHDEQISRKVLEKLSLQLQDSVVQYLKGSVSVLLSDWGRFPEQIYPYYQNAISIIRRHPENVQGFFISSIHDNEKQPAEFQPLRSLYQPPLLVHLLEAGRWDAAVQKLLDIIRELKGRKSYIYEYVQETAMALRAAVMQTVHKQGLPLEHLAAAELLGMPEHEAAHSVDSLETWGSRLILSLQEHALKEAKGSHHSSVQKAQQFVHSNLEHDISLQSLADHVYLHPAYLSKIFKLETGEGVSDYIYRLRMEKASYLLIETNEKIHEISKKSGYPNPSHFSRVFKKYFDMTPEEYRSKEV